MNIRYKFTKWLIACLMIFPIVSCEDDFLDKNPLDSISNQTFWKTKQDLETGLTGVYSRLQNSFLGYERIYFEGLTDNAYCDVNWNQRYIFEMSIGDISPTRGGAMDNMYSAPYVAIASCNLFLDNVDKAKDNVSEEELDVFKAEVRFIRALCYFDLVRLFGDVVIYRNYFETIEEGKIAKSDKSEVYTLIEEDLDFAISKLPDTKYSGHAVKGSAQALLGRVLLTQEKWADAASVLKQIIDGGKFQLSDSYRDIFLTEGQDNPTVNCEIMFSTKYLSPGNPQRLTPQPAGYNIELGQFAMLQPFKRLADVYQMADGTIPTPSADSIYANRDPRLYFTMKLPKETWTNPATGIAQVIEYPTLTGFVAEKYVDLSQIPITGATGASTDQDYVHLRYADVLLMYAEAKNESSGPDDSVYDAIDQVRERTNVDMPPVNRTLVNNQESVRTFIRQERRVELALEGIYYFDLKRWRTATTELNGKSTVGNSPMVFLEKHYYLPLPQGELDRNPKLVQNPDYK